MRDERDDLDRRIAELEARLDAVPHGPAAASLRDELGQLLLVRYAQHRTAPTDRDRAITLLEQALTGPVADLTRTRAALGLLLFLRAMPVDLGPDADGTRLMTFVTGLMSGAFDDAKRLTDRRRAAGYLAYVVADDTADPLVRDHAQAVVAMLELLEAKDPTAQMQALMRLCAIAGNLGGQQEKLISALNPLFSGPLEPESLLPVLDALPQGHRLQPIVAAEIGVLIAERGHVGTLPTHLAGSGEMLREAFETLRDDDPLRDETVRKLAGTLLTTVAYTADPADVTRVVELAEQLVAEAPPDPVAAGKDRYLRGMALTLRGRLAGDPDDLRAGAEDLAAALDAVPADDLISPVIAGTLGALLNDRHLLLGLRTDADAGQAFLDDARAALARHPGSADLTVVRLLGLMSRATKAILQRDADALDPVIDGLTDGLGELPEDYPWRSRIDASLGLAHLTRGTARHDLADIRAGLARLRRAGNDLAVEVSGRPALGAVGAVGTLLDDLLDGADEATLAAAADRLTQAVESGPLPRDDRITLGALQAQVALIRYDFNRTSDLLAEAVAGFQRLAGELREKGAAHPLTAHIHTQLAAACRLAGDETAAVGAGLAALRAYGDEVLLQSGAGHGLAAARNAADQAVALAGRCLDTDRVEVAVEALELGRGLVLHAATVGAGVADLLRDAGHADLARQWERQPSTEDGEVPSDLRHRALTALRAAERGRLAATPPVEAIAAALRQVDADALVYLLPGDDAGGRLLVIPATGPAVPLPAPALTRRTGLVVTGGRTRDLGKASGSPAPLDELCDWAWPALIDPLLRHFGDTGPDRPHRIVLVPVGGLGAVPWHAARGPGGRWANEPFAFSSAASARQLTTAAVRPSAPASGPVTVLGDPTGDLPGATEEVEFLRRYCYPSARVAGSAADILDALAGDALVHLACHARAAATAEESTLQLDGETLPVARILAAAQRRSGAGGLVVLSACVSDLTGATADEALTLATAFLAAGAGGVVGSRWPVDDEATALLMAMFHRYRLGGLRDRDALRAAQRWMLDPDRDVPAEVEPLFAPVADRLTEPELWAPFVHHGR